MMDINILISRLLFQNSRVVIPDFGVLETTMQEAFHHPVSNEFFPKFKKISFTKNYQAEDKMLVKALQGNDAEQQINIFVDKLKDELNQQKKYTMPHLGVFSLHSSGAIVFEQETDFNYEKTYFGLESFKMEPIKKVDAKPIIKAAPEPEERKSRAWLWIAILSVASLLVVGVFKFMKQNKSGIEREVNPVINRDNTGNKQIDTVKQILSAKMTDTATAEIEKVSPAETIAAKDSLKRNTEAEHKKEVSTMQEKEEGQDYQIKKKYYVIAGCFKSSKKAADFLKEIQQSGYPNASIEGKTRGGLIRVCYAGFAKSYQAKKFIKQAEQKKLKGLWIQKIVH